MSAPAAAAASASTSSGTKRPLSPADADRDDGAEKKSRTSSIECTTCPRDFAEDDIRVLPCAHRVCLTCLEEMIRLRARHDIIICPECTAEQSLPGVPNWKTPRHEIMEMFPTIREFNEDVRRREQISSQSSPPAAATTSADAASSSSSSSAAAAAPSKRPPSCSEDDCDVDATHFCPTCGLQCAAHEESSHVDAPDHVRSNLAEQKEQKKRKSLAAAEVVLEQRRREVATLEAAADEVIARVSATADLYQFTLDSMQADRTAITEMSKIVDRWQADKVARLKWMQACRASKKKNDNFLRKLESAKSAAAALSADLLSKTQEEMEAACDTDIITKIREGWEEWYGGDINDVPIGSHIAVSLVEQLQSPSLLPSLAAETREALQGFLPPGKTTANAQLLYKASRDGWLPKDFYQCCSEKGPTLTIIKAAGSEYIFGAYTAVSWPKATDDNVTVPDPSGTSFLFSLTNDYDRPFRLSLVDRNRAISVGSGFGPIFGRQVEDDSGTMTKYGNFHLMDGGKGADEKDGNFSNSMDDDKLAYRLDPWTNEPPNGFELNTNTLAGWQDFAATEIEVYAM